MRALLTAAMLAVSAGAASAGCLFATSPCSTDDRGNTYTTQQNLGGGYNTYRNGSLHSQTSQDTLGTGYTERYTAGGYRRYDSNPYASDRKPRYRTIYEQD